MIDLKKVRKDLMKGLPFQVVDHCWRLIEEVERLKKELDRAIKIGSENWKLYQLKSQEIDELQAENKRLRGELQTNKGETK